MAGFQQNPYPFFTKADFFVLSSRYEGYPTVLFEALYLKKKILATEVSGVREMLQNGNLGIIVNNTEEDLIDGMEMILSNPDSYHQIIKNISNFVFPFELEKSVSHIEKILNE